MDKRMRLRLVVRRNGLPDVRIIFNISLADDPTVVNLLEQINDDIPLEDAHGQWGLEDYAVELHGKDGQPFECLHYQPVAGVLEKDDEVFIRPLMTVDLKKRRLAGRDQILHGGQHLIDGVPFGRNRLRIPRGRPSVNIAPRKRRRLTYHGDAIPRSPQGYIDEDLESIEQQEDEQAQTPLLISPRGAPNARLSVRHVRFPPGIGSSDEPEEDYTELSQEEHSQAESPQDEEAMSSSEGEDADDLSELEPSADEVAAELEDLRALAAEENATTSAERFQQKGRSASPAQSPRSTRSLSSLRRNGGEDPSPEAITREDTHQEQLSKSDLNLSGPLFDKITAIRFAYPQVSPVVCGQLLIKHNLDVSKTWHILAKTIRPRQGLAETMVVSTQLELPQQIQVVSSSPEPKATQGFGEFNQIEDELPNAAAGEEDAWPSEGEDQPDEDEEDDEDEDEEDYEGGELCDANTHHIESNDDDSGGDGDEAPEELSTRPTQESQFHAHALTSRSNATSSGRGAKSDAEFDVIGTRQAQETRSRGPARMERRSSPVHKSSSSSNSSNASDDSSDPSDEDEAASVADDSRGSKDLPVSLSSTSVKVNSLPHLTEIQNEKPISASIKPSGQESSSESSSGSSSESDSESSSGSSSDSSSDSDSESVTGPRRVTKSKGITSSEKKRSQVSQVPRVVDQNAVPQTIPQPVAPGQGKTRTQKRNLRRRLQNQKKKAVLQNASEIASGGTSLAMPSSSEPLAESVDLVAMKQALLQMLEDKPGSSTPHTPHNEVTINTDDIAHATVEGTTAVSDVASEDSEAWRRKILYRAVECVQEGIELSEPPFPFKQRWDPQQRWEYQRGSQGRGKRKSRDNSQFYDDAHLHDTKKHKIRHNAQSGKATRPLDYEDDIILDYDDAPPHVEHLTTDEPRNLSSELGQFWADESNWLSSGVEDDLPSLPEDVSSLPKLTKDNLVPGSIIAWKQLLCTEATNWQPQISHFMTAIVLQVHGDGENMQVQLAKRDRTADKNEKKFDEETGQRIYGKFEVPDEDEDEDWEEDDGVRDTSLSQMIDACLVQKRSNLSQPDQRQSQREPSESTPSAGSAGPDYEVANTPPADNLDSKMSSRGGEKEQSETLDHEAPEPSAEHGLTTSLAMDIKVVQDSAIADSSLIPDRSPSRQLEEEDADNMLALDGHPSRQLEEEYASSIYPAYPADMSHRGSSAAPSEYGSRDVSQDESQPAAMDISEMTTPRRPTSRQTITGLAMPDSVEAPELVIIPEEYDSVRTDPKKVDQSKPEVSQDTLPSDQIGRQIDPNLVTHSYELGTGISNTPSIIHGFDDQDAGVVYGGLADEEEEEGAEMTTPHKKREDGMQRTRANTTTTKGTPFQMRTKSPAPTSPRSDGSTGSSSIFPDIEFLGSQPAKIKFRASPKKIKNEPLGYEDGPSGFNSTADSANNVRVDASVSPPPVTRQRLSQRRMPASSPAPVADYGGSSPPGALADADHDEGAGALLGLDEISEHSADSEEDLDEEAEAEPVYTEMYAEDSEDGDYEEGSVEGSPPNPDASSPVAAEKRRTSWVSGSQGASRKASGRYRGRWTVGGI